jgi:hypothetical protein
VANDFDKPMSDAVELVPSADDAPIFLTGFARSGTTWVNRLMQDYFDAGFANEGQFIISFGMRIQRYGDLRILRNRERLLRDLARDRFFSILSSNYKVDMDWNRITVRAGAFAEIVKEILAQIAEQTGKHRIGSKYPVFGRYLGLLNDLFPDCKVIHVIRDGRDCALSHKQVTWGHQNTYSAAIHWRTYMEASRRSAEAMQGRYLEIRYEDLLLEPETTMRTLEHFIVGTLEYGITKRFLEDRGSLKPEKVGQWRQTMPPRDQAIFESVAGDLLQIYGYPLTGIRHSPSLVLKIGYVAHDRLSRESMHWTRKLFRGVSEYKA